MCQFDPSDERTASHFNNLRPPYRSLSSIFANANSTRVHIDNPNRASPPNEELLNTHIALGDLLFQF
jgi:hypothetical protein